MPMKGMMGMMGSGGDPHKPPDDTTFHPLLDTTARPMVSRRADVLKLLDAVAIPDKIGTRRGSTRQLAFRSDLQLWFNAERGLYHDGTDITGWKDSSHAKYGGKVAYATNPINFGAVKTPHGHSIPYLDSNYFKTTDITRVYIADGPFTFVSYFRLDPDVSPGSDWRTFFSWPNFQDVEVDIASSELFMWLGNGEYIPHTPDVDITNDGLWHLLAVRRNEDMKAIDYILDNKLIASIDITGEEAFDDSGPFINIIDDIFTIGNWDNSQPFYGQIAELAIYASPLNTNDLDIWWDYVGEVW